MKTIVALMTVAIVMASIGMITAVPDADGDLLISMTTQEYVDYYGMKYLEGDRSKCTVETLALYAEDYGIYPTMDIYAAATVTEVTVVPEPVAAPVVAPEPEPMPVQTVEEPEVVSTVPVPEDDGINDTMLMFTIFVAVGIAIILILTTRQNKKE